MKNSGIRLLTITLALCGGPLLRAADPGISSPNGLVQFRLDLNQGSVRYAVYFDNKPILEPSALKLSLDGEDLTDQVRVQNLEPYRGNEVYDWRGVHARATNVFNGLRIHLLHPRSKTSYVLDLRSLDDAVAFRFVVPGTNRARVPDEASEFVLPAGATLWHHDLEGHYEGVYSRSDISDVKSNQWIAPPATFKLPNGAGFASITEADLRTYAGMALQANGNRGLVVRLGHSHPPSHPYRLRYTQEDIDRLAKAAAISGAITTPWRVVMIGRDLNALVNNDAVPNLSAPPDPQYFPKGIHTPWIKPGRAVWKYLDGGGSNTVETVKEFTRMANALGFEHQVIEGFWSRWTDDEIKSVVADANKKKVGLWFWKHSKSLRDVGARREFFKKLHELGVTGAKIDFFDHEAKEVVDLYQSLLREAAEYQILLDFHGANKPAGESRTWPNEMTREAVKGMEASKLEDRATHDTTLPFTRLLAGPAEYTPVVFGPRRANTTYTHQIASAAILSAPLLTYGSHPSNLLASPCLDMIKSIPATWDETIVLEPSAIGELAVFARRIDKTWFLAVLNGAQAQKIKLPLSFLPRGDFLAVLVRDNQEGTATQSTLGTPLRSSNSLTIDLHPGGGFIARFQKK